MQYLIIHAVVSILIENKIYDAFACLRVTGVRFLLLFIAVYNTALVTDIVPYALDLNELKKRILNKLSSEWIN